MTWTTPRTWQSGSVVTAAQMNEQLRDNLLYLLSPNSDAVLQDGTAFEISGTAWGTVGGTAQCPTLVTHGGPLLIYASCAVKADTAGQQAAFDIAVDGVRVADGLSEGLRLLEFATAGDVAHLSLMALGTPAPGTPVVSLQARVTGAGTVTVLAGDTAGGDPDLPLYFFAIEL